MSYGFICGERPDDLAKRNKEMYRRRLAGETYKSIGKDYGLSRDSVSAICKKLDAKAHRRCVTCGQKLEVDV